MAISYRTAKFKYRQYIFNSDVGPNRQYFQLYGSTVTRTYVAYVSNIAIKYWTIDVSMVSHCTIFIIIANLQMTGSGCSHIT